MIDNQSILNGHNNTKATPIHYLNHHLMLIFYPSPSPSTLTTNHTNQPLTLTTNQTPQLMTSQNFPEAWTDG